MYLQRWHGWRHMKLLPSRRVLWTSCTVSHSNATKVALKALLAVWMLGVPRNVPHQTIILFMGTFQRRIHDYFLIHFIMIIIIGTRHICIHYELQKRKKEKKKKAAYLVHTDFRWIPVHIRSDIAPCHDDTCSSPDSCHTFCYTRHHSNQVDILQWMTHTFCYSGWTRSSVIIT